MLQNAKTYASWKQIHGILLRFIIDEQKFH